MRISAKRTFVHRGPSALLELHWFRRHSSSPQSGRRAWRSEHLELQPALRVPTTHRQRPPRPWSLIASASAPFHRAGQFDADGVGACYVNPNALGKTHKTLYGIQGPTMEPTGRIRPATGFSAHRARALVQEKQTSREG